MQLLKKIQLILTFYRNFYLATALITIICISILWTNGISTFPELFWLKIITYGLVYYLVSTSWAKDYFYYQNLGISKMSLWASSLTLDFMIFLLSIIITYHIR